MGTTGRHKRAPALTIPNGTDVSNALPAACFEDMVAMMLYGPATLDALTFALQVNPDPIATNSTTGWVALCDGTGTGLTAPAALKAQVYNEIPHAGALRIKASGNVGAARSWAVGGVETS